MSHALRLCSTLCIHAAVHALHVIHASIMWYDRWMAFHTRHSKIAEEYPLPIPALVLFRRGRAYTYDGPHSSAAIVAYITKQLAPAVRTLQSIEEVEEFVHPSVQQGGVTPSAGPSASAHQTAPQHVSPSYRPAGATTVVGFFSSFDDDECVPSWPPSTIQPCNHAYIRSYGQHDYMDAPS